MVGFKKVENCDSPNIEAAKYKRKRFLFRLGNYLSRAFHRIHHDAPSKRINNRQHSRSTGDLLNDVQSSSSHKPKSTHERLQDHSDSGNASISADDRANSVGHIHAVSTSSSSERPIPTSAFRDELNSKLRLGLIHGTPRFCGPTGTKSADSCGSLASNDSFLCTASPTVSGDSITTSMTRSTYESHSNAVASPSSPHSITSVPTPNMAGMQHKLAVGRQHKRRPPTRTDQADDGEDVEVTEKGDLTPRTLGCTQFFSSSNKTTSMSFTQSPMYLISEESSEESSKSTNTTQPANYPTDIGAPCSGISKATPSPVVAPRQSCKHAIWANRKLSGPQRPTPSGPLSTPSNRPLSMFVALPESTPIESQKHHHQRSLPSPTTEPVNGCGASLLVHEISSRIKSRSTSEQSQNEEVRTVHAVKSEAHEISENEQDVVQDAQPNASCNRIPSSPSHSIAVSSPVAHDNSPRFDSTSPTNIPSPKTASLTDSRPTVRPRSKFSTQLMPTDTALSSDVTTEINLNPVGLSERPASMFFPPPPPYTSVSLNRPPSICTPNSLPTTQPSRSKSCFTSRQAVTNKDDAEGLEPKETSVSSRAALFGATLTVTKPQRSLSGVAGDCEEKTDEHTPTTNARPVSVFHLVRNFEHPR